MASPLEVLKEELLALTVQRPELVGEVDAAKRRLDYLDHRMQHYKMLIAMREGQHQRPDAKEGK